MTNHSPTQQSAPPTPPQNTPSGSVRAGGTAPAGPTPEEVNDLIQHLSHILIRLTSNLGPK